ncbi:MAG: urease accessory protein UreF [Alphaproteobacteria bacterium]|nr:urease accessory protein UreF [Alphaproteobacteria bacterium]
MRTAMTINTGIPILMTNNSSLYRLLAWLSPSFPVGAFSYSHGLEYAVETGLVHTRDTLVSWIATLLRHGSGLSDAMLFVAAWRALEAGDQILLAEIFELAAAMRPTSELALETQAQGAAFARAIRDAWPLPEGGAAVPQAGAPSYPLIVAHCAHAHGIAMHDALESYLHAFTANLISAGVRLIPLGQTDGQIALRLLEAEVAAAADMAQTLPLSEIGSATPMLDYCSALHETQYTRLFRS